MENEPVIFAMEIRETGEYEIPRFYPFAKETRNTYFSVIQDLYNRGIREPLLFIADGIPKLDEEIRKIFPESDKNEIDHDLKDIFTSDTKESAMERFNHFKNKWSSKYPKPV